MTGSPTTARSQAEANLDSAQWNVGRGDRVHAAVHIAQAVAADPSFGVSYEEAERLVTAAPRLRPVRARRAGMERARMPRRCGDDRASTVSAGAVDHRPTVDDDRAIDR